MNEGPRRPRILLVTRNLPPLVGGMERLNWHMAEELAKVADVRIVGPEGASALAPVGIPVREVALRPLWHFLWQAMRLARAEARAWRPDWVLAGSGLTAPLVRVAARACDARHAVYAHGLDVAVEHPLYKALWRPAIRGADRVIVNSAPTAELCQRIGVPSHKLGVVNPGVDLASDADRADARAGAIEFRTRHGLENRALMLSVGRLSTRKGLVEFVTHSLPGIVARKPDAMLLVVGDAPVNALHARSQSAECLRKAAHSAGVGDQVILLGAVPDALLRIIYAASDVHVFPVRNIPGDPEGFGMVAVEAAAFGVPTVAFASGGVVDAVSHGQSGSLVAPEDYAGFSDAVVHALEVGAHWERSCLAHASQFAWVRFGERIAGQFHLLSGVNIDREVVQ